MGKRKSLIQDTKYLSKHVVCSKCGLPWRTLHAVPHVGKTKSYVHADITECYRAKQIQGNLVKLQKQLKRLRNARSRAKESTTRPDSRATEDKRNTKENGG